MRSQEFVTFLSGGVPDMKTQARSSLLRTPLSMLDSRIAIGIQVFR